MSQGVYVLGGKCPGVSVQGVSVRGVYVLGVSVQGGYVLEPFRTSLSQFYRGEIWST